MAFTGYTADKEGNYPDFRWQEQVQDYINDFGKVAIYYDGSQTSLSFKPAHCPSAPINNLSGYKLGVTYSYSGVYFKSWVYGQPSAPAKPYQNMYFAWQIWEGSIMAENQPFPVINNAQVVRPSEKCLLTEYWSNVARQNWGSDQLNNRIVMALHHQRSNLLFSDGHVQSLFVGASDPVNGTQWGNDAMFSPRYDVASDKL